MGEQAIASGWGTLEEDGKPACILQEVTLPVMSNEDCKKTNYSSKMISDNMLCAGYLEGKKDSCQVRKQKISWVFSITIYELTSAGNTKKSLPWWKTVQLGLSVN